MKTSIKQLRIIPSVYGAAKLINGVVIDLNGEQKQFLRLVEAAKKGKYIVTIDPDGNLGEGRKGEANWAINQTSFLNTTKAANEFVQYVTRALDTVEDIDYRSHGRPETTRAIQWLLRRNMAARRFGGPCRWNNKLLRFVGNMMRLYAEEEIARSKTQRRHLDPVQQSNASSGQQ